MSLRQNKYQQAIIYTTGLVNSQNVTAPKLRTDLITNAKSQLPVRMSLRQKTSLNVDFIVPSLGYQSALRQNFIGLATYLGCKLVTSQNVTAPYLVDCEPPLGVYYQSECAKTSKCNITL